MRLNERYHVVISRNVGFKYRLAGEVQKPLDYLHISQNGVVEFPFVMDGPFPGSLTRFSAKFCTAWSGQFERMCSGIIVFRLERVEGEYGVVLYCYPLKGGTYKIQLEIVR